MFVLGFHFCSKIRFQLNKYCICREVKKPGPPFATTVGKGLAVGSAPAPYAPPVAPTCPSALELRQLLQYKPLSNGEMSVCVLSNGDEVAPFDFCCGFNLTLCLPQKRESIWKRSSWSSANQCTIAKSNRPRCKFASRELKKNRWERATCWVLCSSSTMRWGAVTVKSWVHDWR